MKKCLEILDWLLRCYFGFNQINTVPQQIEIQKNQLKIINTESYQRHSQKNLMNDINLSCMEDENKQKLGQAIGKAIAKNLKISFEEITIKKDLNAK